MTEFLKIAAVVAVIAFALWGAYFIGRANGVAAGIALERERMLGPEDALKRLALRMYNAAHPYSQRTRFSHIDKYWQDQFLAAAKVCQSECDEGGAA